MTDLPSYKLVQRLMHETGFPVADPNDEMVFPGAKFMKLASRLIQYGADQELEACCEWLDKSTVGMAELLRAARRPKPPSLKEQALRRLDYVTALGDDRDIIRRALEALPND
jgi:hypothetical protein